MAGNPMMLDKFFDICTRHDIKNIIESQCNEDRTYSILLVGSPNAWELKDIDLTIQSKINLTCLDIASAFEPEFSQCTSNYNTKKFIKCNVFGYTPNEKFDIIVNRWFLHHLTSKNKKDFFSKCKSLLASNGSILSIDYFFTKFSNLDERVEAAARYNEYRSRYSPEPNLSKFINRVRNAEVEDFYGGKMDCIDNMRTLFDSIGLTIDYRYTSDATQIENPDLWGHYVLINQISVC